MKKIIEGKRYDTDTARKIARWNNGLGYSDFHNVNETLYRTKTGRFFIYGEGGAMTDYAKSNGNETSGSEKIIPQENEEALEWLENHDFTQEIEAEFPDKIQDA
jgi:hypothetical protein